MPRLLVAGLTLALWSCAGEPEPGTPEAAAHALGLALQGGKPEAVLALTTKGTHERLDRLYQKITVQRGAIEQRYPEDARGATKLTYPEGVFEADSAEALFGVLITPWLEKLERGEGLLYGMSARSVRMDGDAVALVSTRAGELLRLEKTDEGWKTDAFEAALQVNLDRVHKNQITLENNLMVFAAMEKRAAKKKAAQPLPDAPANGQDGDAPPPSPASDQ